MTAHAVHRGAIGDHMRTGQQTHGPFVLACSFAPIRDAVPTRARCIRRRWSAADLHYLQTWSGTRPIRQLCRHLHRSERALRCKLHKLAISAKVNAGWGLKQVQAHGHLSARAVLGRVIEGTIRLQCAQVRGHPLARTAHGESRPMPQRWRCLQGTHARPIGEVGARHHLTAKQICLAALHGYCRLIHVRVTEDSLPLCHGSAPLHPNQRLWAG